MGNPRQLCLFKFQQPRLGLYYRFPITLEMQQHLTLPSDQSASRGDVPLSKLQMLKGRGQLAVEVLHDNHNVKARGRVPDVSSTVKSIGARAAPMRVPRRNSSTGLRRRASRRSPRSRACMSRPTSSSCSARDPRRPRSCAWPRLRHLFDWMVIGQIMPTNPAAAVRGPRHIVRRGKTPVLDPAEARQLIDAIDTTTVIGLRDRALIGLMVYSFARIGAAIGMRVEDVYTQNRRLWVRLHEKGGKQHAMPCHHNLETYLHEYIDGAGLASDPKALLFQTYSRATGQLTGNPLPQANAYAMIQRRARAADITTKIGNHTFRATGVTAYLKNGGTLEKAAQMANHASTRHDAAL